MYLWKTNNSTVRSVTRSDHLDSCGALCCPMLSWRRNWHWIDRHRHKGFCVNLYGNVFCLCLDFVLWFKPWWQQTNTEPHYTLLFFIFIFQWLTSCTIIDFNNMLKVFATRQLCLFNGALQLFHWVWLVFLLHSSLVTKTATVTHSISLSDELR